MEMRWNLNRLAMVGVLIVLTGIMGGCMDSDDVGDSYRTFEGQMIADYLESDSNLTLFTQAMRMTSTFTLLKSYGKYTAFIPDNRAMRQWLDGRGKTLEQMDTTEVRDMVYYHLIDGLANAVPAYKTADFPEGSFAVQNMVGRYLAAAVRQGTGGWTIKNGEGYADIVSANNEMINGVVHVIGEVLEGNNDLVGDFVSAVGNGRYRIFGQALLTTGWRDSLTLIDDPLYVMPEGDLPANSVGQTSTYFGSWPKQKRFLYMCFAESDSIMQLRENITSLDDLRAYAAKVYPDAIDEDETSPNNSLHQFVGYHLYDVQMAKNKLVLSRGSVSSYDWFTWRDYICDANYRVEQFLIPMQPNMLLNVQNANTVDFDQASMRTIPVLNCPYSPYDKAYSTMAGVDWLGGWPVIKVIEGDQYCQNGVVHGLNHMLVFSKEVKAQVFHRRIRTDFRTYMPEAYNNGILYDLDRSYNWFYSAFPDGYCHLIKFSSNSNTTLHYEGRTPHDYLLGDRWEINGNFDITFTVGPVPAGSYEMRIGYTCGGSDGAVVQAYMDGQPCGIPIDTRVSAYNGDTGWIQDWLAIQESQSNRFAGQGESEEDPYGLENDKNLRNHGFMKAPNSFVGWNYHDLGYGDNLTARNVDTRLRRILGIYNWTSDGPHQFRLVAMKAGKYQLDYIEFMPTDLLDEEDQH